MAVLISEISRIYAKALLESVGFDNAIDTEKQLQEISKLLSESDDFRIVMSNSSISASKKHDIIKEVFGGKIEQKLLNFLQILIEKDRFNELESIKECFTELIEKMSNKKTVEIISPIELSFENKTNVLFKLEHKLNCEISPVWSVDKDLIAGLVYKFNDYVIDTSVRAKLENLSKVVIRG